MSQPSVLAWQPALQPPVDSWGRWERFGLPRSTIMIHQPLGGIQGQATHIGGEISRPWRFCG